MEITLTAEATGKIEQAIREHGVEPTSELVNEVSDRLLGLWEANLSQDVGDLPNIS